MTELFVALDFDSAEKAVRMANELAPHVDGFKVGLELPPGTNDVYVFHIEPVPALTFDPVKILYESGAFERAKADELYAKLKDSYARITPWPLVSVGR